MSPKSPDGAVHHEVDCCASRELSNGAFFYRCIDFDLSHVSVSSILVVSQHCDLDHEGADWLVCPLKEKCQSQDYILYHRAATTVYHPFHSKNTDF